MSLNSESDDLRMFIDCCFVGLQHGQIFVFTGLLKVISNDHELATVLGHEIAHAILQNGVCISEFYTRM